ncbi:MAG: LLM class flavin-dependent oxidoreductase [Candidatus Limnocylindrales bacterium]
MSAIKLGALCWSQYSDWPSLRDVGRRADHLGYDTLWTWDHLYPMVGSVEGPILEGWMVAAAWAEVTTHVRIGLLVGANTFREPALIATMVTTLDHLSGGRAILGIGGAWFEPEHKTFGFDFGDGPPERLRWLAEALPVIRGMLRGERPSAAGPRYKTRAVRNDPSPCKRSCRCSSKAAVSASRCASWRDMATRAMSEATSKRSDARIGSCASIARKSAGMSGRSSAPPRSLASSSATRGRKPSASSTGPLSTTEAPIDGRTIAGSSVPLRMWRPASRRSSSSDTTT